MFSVSYSANFSAPTHNRLPASAERRTILSAASIMLLPLSVRLDLATADPAVQARHARHQDLFPSLQRHHRGMPDRMKCRASPVWHTRLVPGEWRFETFDKERLKVALLPEEKLRLLSMVDILEPLSKEELEGFSRRVPDTHVERGRVFFTQGTEAMRSSCSRRAR
jgi:hypothetical protein